MSDIWLIVLTVLIFILCVILIIFSKLKPLVFTKSRILKGYFILMLPLILLSIGTSISQDFVAEKNELAHSPYIIGIKILGVFVIILSLVAIFMAYKKSHK